MADLSMYKMNEGGSLQRRKPIRRVMPSTSGYLAGGDALYFIEGTKYFGASGDVWKLNTAEEKPRWERLPRLSTKDSPCGWCIHGRRYNGDYCEFHKQAIPAWYSGVDCIQYKEG